MVDETQPAVPLIICLRILPGAVASSADTQHCLLLHKSWNIEHTKCLCVRRTHWHSSEAGSVRQVFVVVRGKIHDLILRLPLPACTHVSSVCAHLQGLAPTCTASDDVLSCSAGVELALRLALELALELEIFLLKDVCLLLEARCLLPDFPDSGVETQVACLEALVCFVQATCYPLLVLNITCIARPGLFTSCCAYCTQPDSIYAKSIARTAVLVRHRTRSGGSVSVSTGAHAPPFIQGRSYAPRKRDLDRER